MVLELAQKSCRSQGLRGREKPGAGYYDFHGSEVKQSNEAAVMVMQGLVFAQSTLCSFAA